MNAHTLHVCGERFDADQAETPCEGCDLDQYSCVCEDEPETCCICGGPETATGGCDTCDNTLVYIDRISPPAIAA